MSARLTRLLWEARVVLVGVRCLAWAPVLWVLQRIERWKA